MGSFEANYTEEELRKFTDQERALLRDLHDGLDAKFDEIARFLAIQLGYNAADPRGREEAQDAIDRWEEDVEIRKAAAEIRKAAAFEPTSPLQRLLREHYDISELIMNIHDDAIQRDHEGDVE
jgi:hypothetical protein